MLSIYSQRESRSALHSGTEILMGSCGRSSAHLSAFLQAWAGTQGDDLSCSPPPLWKTFAVPKIAKTWAVLTGISFHTFPLSVALGGPRVGPCVCFSDAAHCLASQRFRCEEEWTKLCCVADGWWWDWSWWQVHIWAETICWGNFVSPLGQLKISGRVGKEYPAGSQAEWLMDCHHFPLQPPNMFVFCWLSYFTFTQVLFCGFKLTSYHF